MWCIEKDRKGERKERNLEGKEEDDRDRNWEMEKRKKNSRRRQRKRGQKLHKNKVRQDTKSGKKGPLKMASL